MAAGEDSHNDLTMQHCWPVCRGGGRSQVAMMPQGGGWYRYYALWMVDGGGDSHFVSVELRV